MMRMKVRCRFNLVLKLVVLVLALALALALALLSTGLRGSSTNYIIKQHAKQPNTYGSCKGPWVNWYEEFHAKSLLTRSSADRKTPRYLVYLCHGQHQGCGGFGNRIIGLVSLFYLAMLTNRVFLIHWGGPNKLETFLQPNKINWTYDGLSMQGLKMHRAYWGVWGPPGNYDDSRIEDYPVFLNWTEKQNFDVVLDQDVEAIGTIWYFAEQIWKNSHLYKRAKQLGLPPKEEDFPFAMLGCAMDFLFKKSPYFEYTLTQARRYLKVRPRPHIGIHIRTSDHHWGDSNPYSIRTKNLERVVECVQRVQAFFQAKNKVGKRAFTWFLAVDDLKIKELWLKRFPANVVSLQTNPKHLDSSDEAAFRDILLDLFLLSESDYFIATWESTFSFVAMGIRGFSVKSFTYGERCNINNTSLELAD